MKALRRFWLSVVQLVKRGRKRRRETFFMGVMLVEVGRSGDAERRPFRFSRW
jgi:hypothetical protein